MLRPRVSLHRREASNFRWMRRTASYLGFRVAWPPLFVYWNRDPAPWDAERGGVHTAFLMCSAVFWALNLFWFRKLVAMARGARRKAK